MGWDNQKAIEADAKRWRDGYDKMYEDKNSTWRILCDAFDDLYKDCKIVDSIRSTPDFTKDKDDA